MLKSIAMALKPVAYPDPGTSGASLDQPGSAGFLEPLVRGLAWEGGVNLVRAKSEVRAALRAGGRVVPPASSLEDCLPPGSIPSVAAGGRHDRVLAEIDQEGFAFAIDPVDEPFFNRRNSKLRRRLIHGPLGRDVAEALAREPVLTVAAMEVAAEHAER